jgi:hypothetical protein
MGVSQLQNFAARLILFVSEKIFSRESRYLGCPTKNSDYQRSESVHTAR